MEIIIWIAIIFWIRNIYTFIMQLIIMNYIEKYNKNNKEEPYINYYAMMQHYLITFFRIWDWGYKHILPKEVLEKIKPNKK